MDTNDFFIAAQKFYNEIVVPIERTIDEKEMGLFRCWLYGDLHRITKMCGGADGNFDIAEITALIFFSSTLFEDQNYFLRCCQFWESLAPDIKAAGEEQALRFINGLEEGDVLLAPSATKVIDKKYQTNFFDKMIKVLYGFAQLIVKADDVITNEEVGMLKKVWSGLNTLWEISLEKLSEFANDVKEDEKKIEDKQPLPVENVKAADPKKTLPKKAAMAAKQNKILPQMECNVIDELEKLIGMENIKEEVHTLINFLKVQKERLERGLSTTPISLHAVFTGFPGTGKTTIARLLGKIYSDLGFLSKGHLVESDRTGLVAGYVGQTSLKVDEIVNSALDGVLFIDEAYALHDEMKGDYGREAIGILLKRMEDYRDRLVVIVAGYPAEMKAFIESNPGLKSRFNRYFQFNHYTPAELSLIFEKFCKDGNYILTPEAIKKVKDLFENLYANKDRTFGNGRLARNIFEKTIQNQANRIAGIVPFTNELLSTILEEDIPSVEQINTI